MKRLLIVAGVLVLLVATGTWLAATDRLPISFSPAPPEPLAVLIEQAKEANLIESVQAPGRIEPFTVVKIQAEVSARVMELGAREGMPVRRGDVVCRLDSRELEASLALARARRDGEMFRLRADQRRLDGLATNLEFAKRELERRRALHASGDIPDRELDTAIERSRDLETTIESTTFAISVAESAIAAAEAEIRRAETALDATTIRSPIDGRLVTLNVEEGEVVTGSTQNPGTVIMVIADFSRMLMHAEIAESDVARLAGGQTALIRINAYPDDVFTGRVREIAVRGTDVPGGVPWFRTEIELDMAGAPRLIERAGLLANVDIEIASHAGIVVPYQAILVRPIDDLPESVRNHEFIDPTRTRTELVARVVNGRTMLTPVRAGPSDLSHRIVHAGLTADDLVVTGPFKVLETIGHDQPVRRRGDVEAPAKDEPSAVQVVGG